jgi:hypothetical protein
VLVKGVQHPADVELALRAGVDGIIVSNHGGRQVDGAAASLDALPSVVAAVRGRVPVLLDSGVRGGADPAIALAPGATAVLVGRPPWGPASLTGDRPPGDCGPDRPVPSVRCHSLNDMSYPHGLSLLACFARLELPPEAASTPIVTT